MHPRPKNRHRRPSQTPAARPFVPVGLALGLAAAGCRSPEEHRRAADDEVYAIVAERRAELAGSGAFSIDPPAGSLRARIVEAASEGTILDLPPLGFLECLEIAAENSREYQDQREDLYLAALDLTLERWVFRVHPSATADASVVDGGVGETTAGVGAGFGLSKLFGSGAVVIGDIGLDLFRAISTGDGWDALSNASISVTQPLLRGFGARIVLEPLTQAERDVVYEARDYERFRRTFAFNVAARMFRIAQQVATLANEEQNRITLAAIRARNEAFAEAGQLLDIEVDQALQNELRAQNSVVEAQRNLQALYDELKLFLGLPVETRLSIRDEELGDLFGLVVPATDFAESLAVRVALERRLDHQTALDRVADAERRVVVAADDLRGGLALVAAAGVRSAEGRPLDPDLKPWALSLELDLPIDQLGERNAYRAAWIGLQVARRAAEESSDEVVADVRDAQRGVAAAREQVEIQESAVFLAERRVESARMQQEAGRADTRDLLDAQEDLVEAQNAAVQARVDLTLAQLALYRDMELLRVDERGLTVETAPLSAEGGAEDDG